MTALDFTGRDDRPTWYPVAGSEPLTYVAKAHGRPVAIIEVIPGAGCRLTSSRGEAIGIFSTLTDVQSALLAWLDTRSQRLPVRRSA